MIGLLRSIQLTKMPIAFVAAAALVLTSCTLSHPSNQAVVGSTGADFMVSGVHIQVPADSAPKGTVVHAQFDASTNTDTDPAIRPLADSFRMVLGEGLQPASPITVTMPIDKSILIDTDANDPAQTIGVLLTSADGSMDAAPATYDAASGTVTARIPHLSWIRPFQLDVGRLFHDATDGLLKALNIKTSKPDCADGAPTVGGVAFSVSQPDRAWVCLSEVSGNLVATVTGNSPVSFDLAAQPSATSAGRGGLDFATTLTLAVMDTLKPNGGFPVIFNGGTQVLTFNGAPTNGAAINFQEDPGPLLVLTLAHVLETVGGKFGAVLDATKLTHLSCLQNIAATATGNQPLSDIAANTVKSFFACVGPTVGNGVGNVVLGMIAGAPQLLSGFIIGAVDALSRTDAFAVQIKAQQTPTTQFITFDPWHNTSAIKITPGPNISRCQPSLLVTRSDAYRCAFEAAVEDPCFQSPTSIDEFLCPHWSGHSVRYSNATISFRNAAGDTPDRSSVFMAELVDGTLCRASSGDWPEGTPGSPTAPGFPTWRGWCVGPSAGVWRTGGKGEGTGPYSGLYQHEGSQVWQIAISEGSDASVPTMVDIKTAYR